MTFIAEFGLLFIIVVAIAFMAKLLRQPILVGYVASGLIFALFIAKNSSISDQLILFSQLGITFLLFLMGLEFDLKELKYLGKDILLSTSIQSILFFLSGFGLSLFFSFTWLERIYLGISFMVCSTLLVAKIIDDKKESQSLYGKLVLGTLIVQDILTILAITILGTIQKTDIVSMLEIPTGIFLLILAGFVLSRYILNYSLRFASRYPELLFIFSLSICFAFVELALRLSIPETIGAFIGGVVLANTIYKADISSRLKPLLTFFNMLFFVGLGFMIVVPLKSDELVFMCLFVLASFIIKPIITYLTLRMLSYDIKQSFLASISLSPLSEFSIILVLSASESISDNLLPIVSITSIASMVFGSYIIKYDRVLWKYAEKPLRSIDKFFKQKDVQIQSTVIDAQVLFFGYYELGSDILETLKSQKKKIVVVEHDPAKIEKLKAEGIQTIFSSINEPEFFEHHTFLHPQIVVSNIKDPTETKLLLEEMKKRHPTIMAIVTSKTVKDSVELYDAGADYVIYPTYVNEQKISILLNQYETDANKLIEQKMLEVSKFKSAVTQTHQNPVISKVLDLDTLFDKIEKGPSDLLFKLFQQKK
jgi:Kef-type K+ transport system membrane component KefB/Trk K+ transport system NAD-binding subunit